jgi:hypothetical protein
LFSKVSFNLFLFIFIYFYLFLFIFIYEVLVDLLRRVQFVSRHFPGANNDQAICQNDRNTLAILNGKLSEVAYQVYNETGRQDWIKGGYLISDGGFIESSCFIDPDHQRMTREAVLWSEWVESVRKDVECKYFIFLILNFCVMFLFFSF